MNGLVVFPVFFNLNLNFAIRSSLSEPQLAPGLVFSWRRQWQPSPVLLPGKSHGWRSSIQSVKIRPGADCGLDHELFIAKFWLKLKKVWKTTRPFRYKSNPL